MIIETNSAKLARFREVWDNLDEDTKEILAGALYVLNRNTNQVIVSHHITKYAMSDKRLKLLRRLADYTERN
jgi:hypothetical protein